MKKKRKLVDKVTNSSEKRLLSLNAIFSEEVGAESFLRVVDAQIIAKSSMHHNSHFDSFMYHKNISRIITNSFFDEKEF